MAKKKQPIEGYCVITETLSGPELVWRTGEGEEEMPQVFETEREAQLEYIDALEEDIRQFKEGEREWEDIHWPDEYHICPIVITEKGEIWVYDDNGNEIIDTTLELWRKLL